jgi:hypothetical protein
MAEHGQRGGLRPGRQGRLGQPWGSRCRQRPDIIDTDTGTYSDLVFGLSQLLGVEYRPELADMPDQRPWRIDAAADYGPLNTAARGRIDLDRVRRHWEDILRVVASIYTGTVRAYDVIRMLRRDGNPTPLGEAIALYARIFKRPSRPRLHRRRDLPPRHQRACATSRKAATRSPPPSSTAGRASVRALPQGHGRPARCARPRPQLHRALEHPLHERRLDQLRAPGRTVLDEDVARLSPFIRHHLNVRGK